MSKVVKRVGKYELGRTLGEGTFAKVKFAFNTETKVSFAMKILEKEKILKHKMVDQIKREISIMKLVRHPNIVRLHEVLASKKNIFIVLEFVSGGELFDKIVHQGRLSETESRKYFQQLVEAMEFCHSKGVYHRDLKPENLLLDEQQNLKISDFGLSALPQQVRDDGLLHTTCGTPNYVAPEVLLNKGYEGSAADMWSCGVILYVLMAGFLPFDEPDLLTLYSKIAKAEFKCPRWFSPAGTDLIRKILDPNPTTRVKYEDLLRMEWFSSGYSPAVQPEEDDVDLRDIQAVFEGSERHLVEERQKGPEPMNAFELIALSQGLQLGAMFERRRDFTRRETRFDSKCPPHLILQRVEQAGRELGFCVQRGNFKLRLERPAASRVTKFVLTVQVYEVMASLYVVEVRKAQGETLDYHKFYKDMYSKVKDIVWLNDKEAPKF